MARGLARIHFAGPASRAGRLQAYSRRSATTGAREGLGAAVRRLQTRNEHDAAMGGKLLVLSPLPGFTKFQGILWPSTGTILDGNGAKSKIKRSHARRGLIRRRHRTRRSPPSLRSVLAQSIVRSRLRF